MKRLTTLVLTCFLLVGFFWGNSIDYTNKSHEQLGAEIKDLDSRIQKVEILPTDSGDHAAVITYLAGMSPNPILTEGPRIKDVLKAISTGEGTNPLIGVNILIHEPSTDKLGNKGQALAVTLGWHTQTLSQINWKNAQDWQVLGLSGILERGPFGNEAIAAYCKDGASSYGEDFCRNAGY